MRQPVPPGDAVARAGVQPADAALDAATRGGPFVFPASFAQRRLWFLDRWEPGTALYNIPFAARLEGRLDHRALEKSLNEIARRHEMLRTTFAEVDGEPVQVIAPETIVPLPVVDTGPTDAEMGEARALRLAREHAGRPFDLERGPLLRAALLRLAPDDHLLVVTLHHIVSDAWSHGVLLRELTALYPAFREGRAAALPDLPLQYADFAVWQRESIEAGDLKDELAGWRRRLEGAPALLRLPTDRPRPPIATGRGASRPARVPGATLARLQALCRAERGTTFMAILAVFQSLLGRRAACDDLVVGTPVAGRAHPDLERLIGCFINTLALRADLSGRPTFRALLGRTREGCLQAYAGQEVPFETVLDAIRPERRLDRAPLFQAMLALDNVPLPDLALPDLRASLVPLGTGTAKYDLTLALREEPNGLRGSMEYSTDLFDPGSIDRLCADFTLLVERAVADPDRTLDELTEGLALHAAPATEISSWPAEERAAPEPDAMPAPAGPGPAAPRTPIEESLAAIWRGLLRLETIGIHDNFFAAGGDSILSLQVVARAHRAGIHLTPRQVFQHPTIAGLAAVAGLAAPMAVESPASGPIPLTPIQRWFFEQDLPEPHHWNQTLVLETRRRLAPSVLEEAARRLCEQHDALRLRFARGPSGWEQTIARTQAPPGVALHDLSGLPEEEQGPAVAAAAARAQASLDLEAGPLCRFALFDLGPERPGRLLIAVHHLAIDGVSWRILLEDLELACRQAARGEPVRLPPKTTSFAAWARRLEERARRGGSRDELDHWLGEGRGATAGLPLDGSGGEPLESSARRVEVELDAGTTRALLREAPRAYRTRTDEVLLAALALAFARVTGETSLRVDLEGHGREDLFEGVDLSRTVGWFTSLFPVVLRLERDRDPGAALRSVKDRLRRIPRRGIGYGILRHLAGDADVAARLRALPAATVSFNYLGQLDAGLDDGSLFALARQDAGPARAGAGRRSHLLEIDGFVAGGRLRLRLTYGEESHRRATIERLAAAWLEALRHLVAHCLLPGAGRTEPADFPLARLERRELDRILAGGAVDDVYPLSPMQEGMLFHTLLAPASGEYVEQLTCTLRGDLDTGAFERAWHLMLERHDALRAAIRWERSGRPLQIVRREARAPLALHDWRDLPRDGQEESWRRLLRDDRTLGFDPARAPLLRLALARTGEREWRWLLSHHHLLLDGWSLAILLKDVFACYEELRLGQAPRPEPVRPYADYIAWLQRQDGAGAEAFWRAALEGFRSPTPLGPSRPPAAATAGEPAATTSADRATAGRDEQEARLEAGVTAALSALARRERLTLNTIVLGAWAVLLRRWSGAGDVLFGATVSGRPADLPGVEELVGLCINTLPVRVRLDPRSDLLPWLRRLQDEQAEQRQHEHVSLAQIRAWADLPQGAPLFESILVFENYPVDSRLRERPGSLAVDDVRSIEWTNYPLTVGVGPGERLVLCLSYDPCRFDADDIAARLGEYRRLLESIAADPARRLEDLASEGAAGMAPVPAAPAAAPRRAPAGVMAAPVLISAAPAGAREDLGLDGLIAAQAARTPDAPAVACAGNRLTYAALETRANRLAWSLRGMGAGPEILVGLCLERSLDLPAAVLGVLKSGAAYLPLDPDSPPERLRLILEDSRPALILVDRALRQRLPADIGARVMDIEELTSPFGGAAEPAGPPPGGALPENLAYVIYTSGSTGAPKGVQVTHGALLSHGLAVAQRYALRADDRVLQFAALSFDVAAEEIFPAWLAGACSVLRDQATSLVVADFLAWAGRERLTVLNLPAAYWHAVVDALAEGGVTLPPSLRLMIVGSDEVSADRWSSWRRHAPSGVRLINAYGPTEGTITATLYEERPAVLPPSGPRVPIGEPIARVEAHVLDAGLRPVEDGVPGDLYLGGAGLARGYLGRPDLTAERFLPHPFGGEPGARLYATGDRALRRPDGTLEFLGRGDAQVKVRGYRVEPGEVEAALVRHPAVGAAVVVANEAVSGGKRLVAYAVPRAGGRLSEPALRHHLERSLPAWMVPAAIVVLESFPLTAGGKIDRRALPAPEPAGRGEAAALEDPVPEIIAGIWADVLGRPHVGRDDSFFALGGHSLLAIQIISRVRDALRIDLPLRSLFDHPTVAGLAVRAEEARREAQGLPPPEPLRPLPRPASVPLSFAQERQWFLDQLVPDRPVYNIHVALRLTGRLHERALRRSLNALVRRHETLRTVFATVDGRPAQVVRRGVRLRLPVTDLESMPEEGRETEALRLSTAEARRPFDLRTGPLIRARLLRLSAEHHVLLLTMHHIVSDGWSASVSARELAALYTACAAGREPDLAAPPIQYADFAMWQRAWLQGATLETQLAYWRRQLDGAPAELRLPADRPRPERHTYEGSTQEFVIPAPLAAQLKELSRREGVTLFMLLLAGFQALLLRYTGQEDMVLGTPIAGRVRTETEGLIGFFVNTLVLRTDLSGDPTFRDLLRRVREVCLDAYTHQDLPFEKLVEDLAPERTLSRTPLVQVMFQLQTATASTLRLPGLDATHLEVDSGTTQFDLSVDVLDMPEGLSAVAEYSTDLFDAPTIARLMRGYLALLEGAAGDPERRLSDLPLLAEKERRALLASSVAPAESRAGTALHRLVESQARLRPQSAAVAGEGEPITFGDLDRRAARLAGFLGRQGVGAETLVGVLLERSADLAIAALAVLKAGGTYLPLDPANPDERLGYILDDAAPRLILTRGTLRGRLEGRGARLIDLDGAGDGIERGPLDGCASAAALALGDAPADEPARAAYLIYTSGSSGRPKGVLVPHEAAVNHCLGVARAFGLGPGDRALQFASPGFDVSLEEMFATWSAGGTLVLSPGGPPAPAALAGLVARERLTVLNLPSSYWHEWVAELQASRPELPGCLRLVVVGSEPIDARRYAEWRLLAPPALRWIGAYGTTETAVTSLLCEPASRELLAAPERPEPAPVEELPIGRPIANVEAYVLDRALQPVPGGATGELYLGGTALARGYLGRPDLTAERFVPHPWSKAGARLYRTGDRARRRADGQVVFLGRADRQVKLRGYRIEPGEIEALLKRHPAVSEAAVVAREDAPGQQRLVAYVAPDFSGAGTATDLGGTEARAERLDDWRQVHDDEVFNETSEEADPAFNIGGWNSSYTGEPIPAEEMREWVDGTVERLLALRPKRVLEIGCGTGLLLFRVAPTCVAYTGTDFSRAALDHVRRAVERPGASLSGVRLMPREACDFSGLEAGEFDLVVINSVAQYFPGIDYLMQVLRGALRLVQPGGHVFLGDLRSLPLLRAFHLSLALQRAPATLTVAQLEHLVAQRLFQEEELAVDPGLFPALRRHVDGIAGVETRIRTGRHHNELTRYRYDAILRAGSAPPHKGATPRGGEAAPDGDAAPPSIDWPARGLTLAALGRLLADEGTDALRVTNVPNARLSGEASALERLAQARSRDTVRELRARIERFATAGVDPEDVRDLARALHWTVEIDGSPGAVDGRFDVLFRRPGRPGPSLAELADDAAGAAGRKHPLGAFTNNPLQMKLSRRLLKTLPGYLSEALPAWMVPASFVPLQSLPRTPGGKIDHAALPAPDGLDHGKGRVAPRDALELNLLRLFEEVLDVRPVGVTDGFFDLGGHSLLAVRLIALAQKRFGREIPLATLFQAPTVERFAAALRALDDGRPWSPAIALQPRGTRTPFFCVHPAGGGVLHYLDLARHLGEDRPFYGLHAPGLYGEREPLGDVVALAREHLAAIRSVQPAGPYALGGWSFGGLVAFEIALRLRAEGETVALVALLDAVPPDRQAGAARAGAEAPDDEDDAEVIAWYAEDFLRFFGRDLAESKRPRLLEAGALRAMEPEERLRYLHGVAAAVNGLPPDAGLERVRRYVEMYRVNQRAARNYAPGAVYPGAVTLFRAAESGGDGPTGDAPADADTGWAAWVGGDLQIETVPGAHDTFIEEPHVPILARQLRLCLDRAFGDL